jgi:uncharacterized membrane protein
VGAEAPPQAPYTRGSPYPPPAAPERFWPAQLTVVALIALQFSLPDRLTVGPSWVVPGVEGVLLLGLLVATPNVIDDEHPRRRRVTLSLVALVSVANIYSLGALVKFLFHHDIGHGKALFFSGVVIWLTNFLVFGLWFWEIDRGGPGRRSSGRDTAPDFLFPQMNDDTIEPRNWRPRFVDYLYVGLTNAMAFSPTDTLPLSTTAKSLMGLQSLVALVTFGLIVARAVNILGT